MPALVLLLACTAAIVAVLLGLHARTRGGSASRLRRAHAALCVPALVTWVVFLAVAGRVGDLAASVVGIVALGGWWCVGVGGLLLAVRERPGAEQVLGHLAVVALVAVLTWAYAVDLV